MKYLDYVEYKFFPFKIKFFICFAIVMYIFSIPFCIEKIGVEETDTEYIVKKRLPLGLLTLNCHYDKAKFVNGVVLNQCNTALWHVSIEGKKSYVHVNFFEVYGKYKEGDSVRVLKIEYPEDLEGYYIADKDTITVMSNEGRLVTFILKQ